MPDLYIKHIKNKGRGVFSNDPITSGEIIEFCPVLVIPSVEQVHLDHTKLYDYYFMWGDDQRDMAIALGYGSLYNHDAHPNANYETYFEEEILVIKAIMDIPAHTEITISYLQDPGNHDKVWFEEK